MKIAILIQCHKNPDQVNDLVDALSHDNIDFYIHVDAKSNISDDIKVSNNVAILPDNKRVNVKWATFSQVEASINLLKSAYNKDDYDYYWLISGQDFPIVNSTRVFEFFINNEGYNFVNLFPSKNNGANGNNNYDKRNEIRFYDWMFKRTIFHKIVRRALVEITGGYKRTFPVFLRKNTTNMPFYFGSSWWCIHKSFAKYLLDYISKEKGYADFYKNTSCPDESFFQTLLMNSPYKNKRKDYLHYVDWSEGKYNPKILTIDDFDQLMKSDKLIARKFDVDVDARIIEVIRETF